MWKEDEMRFRSRRSPVLGRHGMVATSQPLASQAGLEVLKAGGNAVDAAIAVAAVLNVTEPCSTGLGGDCFMLYYEAATEKVHGLNGSGRSPRALTLERARAEARKTGASEEDDEMDPTHVHCVTVPGTAAGWADSLERFGSGGAFTLSRVLAPAVRLADEGFPVGPVTAHWWRENEKQLNRPGNHQEELLSPATGRAPVAGEVFRNPALAATMRELGAGGKEAFYQGRVGRAIVEVVRAQGGCLTLEDLAAHESAWVEPIFTDYGPVRVWEIPPNGQGLTALLALNYLSALDRLEGLPHNGPDYLHQLLEVMRLAFADTRYFVADPALCPAPLPDLLSPAYAARRVAGFHPTRAQADVQAGTPTRSSSTVSFQVVDPAGNAVSFVNSNYMHFGSGLVPRGCGFTLQNRGHNFSLSPTHPNVLAPGKRPFHTIIPGLATRLDSGALYASFSNMGGFMQPQGHVQLLLNLLLHRMDPQAAVDAPRFCIQDGSAQGAAALEEGIEEDVLEELRARGHRVAGEERRGYAHRVVFGKAQVIVRDPVTGVLWGGSDGRGDGCVYGW
ncbi:Gamma-glutamyltranspeptidase [Nannochloropsis gaditana]|uniref:Gamma-glutamyltranspeptidase n=2 Tax=Nannochloropsis gaditana TaxID=72520 RepID=W7TJT7_9STRA|nr:Gamma-glutamyltranspeptidase [Nannochloropsis gaditana]